MEKPVGDAVSTSNPYIISCTPAAPINRHRLPALTRMNFSKNLLESPAYLRQRVKNSVMENPMDKSSKHMNRLVDRVMQETRYVRNENTDEHKERIKSAVADALKDSRDENCLPPPTNYFKTWQLAEDKSGIKRGTKRDENCLPPPTNYFKTWQLAEDTSGIKRGIKRGTKRLPHARLELATLGS
jgi:hypothetical protein